MARRPDEVGGGGRIRGPSHGADSREAPHVHSAGVLWSRDGAVFTDLRYSRGHRWRFDGGVEVPASSSPLVVPRHSVAAAVDPEEAYVAALASCHMLTFLALAARDGFVVDRYEDAAGGTMGQDAEGKAWVARVVLRPAVAWSGERRPTETEIADLHRRAHADCFLARSVRTEVGVAPPG
jgi:organic hydroperoxide reductase OsmC/OhrA